jgi:hypothetical protein
MSSTQTFLHSFFGGSLPESDALDFIRTPTLAVDLSTKEQFIRASLGKRLQWIQTGGLSLQMVNVAGKNRAAKWVSARMIQQVLDRLGPTQVLAADVRSILQALILVPLTKKERVRLDRLNRRSLADTTMQAVRRAFAPPDGSSQNEYLVGVMDQLARFPLANLNRPVIDPAVLALIERELPTPAAQLEFFALVAGRHVLDTGKLVEYVYVTDGSKEEKDVNNLCLE